jgi:hypothetical protein
VIYFWGGWNSPDIVVGPGQGPWLYLLGLLIVGLYAPLYWWRRWQDRKTGAVSMAPGQVSMATAGAGPIANEPASGTESVPASPAGDAATDPVAGSDSSPSEPPAAG